MNKSWTLWIFILSFLLMSLLKSQEVRSLGVYFKAERVLKIQKFAQVKATLSAEDQDYFELWESILTGRTAPLAKWIKERYKLLTLNHLFTPSGFHLTAVLLPFFKFLKNSQQQLALLGLLGIFIYFLPGMGALKRMIFIKGNQKVFGMKSGFILALILDMLFGTFQTSCLSFTYSFLFLGLIYSGKKGLHLIFLIFFGQMLISYFQNTQLSPLLLIVSPLLNFCFGVAMPLLFILALPMWSWQVSTAIFTLKSLQALVDYSAKAVSMVPAIEISIPLLIMAFCLALHHRKTAYALMLLLTTSLNTNQLKAPGFGSYDFTPQGSVKKIVMGEVDDVIYFEDGKCKRRLVNGIWWEKCSPKRRSTRKSKFKKLSYPS